MRAEENQNARTLPPLLTWPETPWRGAQERGNSMLPAFYSLQATAQTPIRGVRPSQWSAHAGVDGSFQCRDGSAKVPVAALNDDYCDCADGSDEPGTSACPNSLFYCANKGHKSSEVFSSMVNDGVCDCCDGSDEWQTGVCENDCIALGAANRAKAEERARLVTKGYEIATQWAARGEASRVSTQAELT